MSDFNALLSGNLISMLGLESLPIEERAAIMERMAELIRKRTMLRILQVLTPEDEEKLAELGDDVEGVMNYLAAQVPNFEEIMNEEIVNVKNEMLKAAEGAPAIE